MEKPLQVCPLCFSEIPVNAQICPHCGSDTVRHSGLDYATKLIGALKHPISEVRMRAIIALGWRSQTDSVPQLLALAFSHPADVVEGIAVVESLSRMGGEGRHALTVLANQHRAHAVREAASKLLNISFENCRGIP